MFVAVNMPDKKGEMVSKHINLSTATIIHDIDPEAHDNKGGFRSVIFMPNGYAAYSNLSSEELMQIEQGGAINEANYIETRGE